MSMTYPVAFPSPFDQSGNPIGIMQWQVFIDTAVTRSPSPTSFREQLYAHGGNRVRLAISWSTLQASQCADIFGWIASLYGGEGTFTFGADPMMQSPRGIALGAPVVNGANQSGTTLLTTGWNASVNGIVARGDWFQLENSLYMAVKTANSDGSGNAALEIYPRMRAIPNSGDALIFNNPTGVFRLDNTTQTYSGKIGNVYTISITATEAI